MEFKETEARKISGRRETQIQAVGQEKTLGVCHQCMLFNSQPDGNNTTGQRNLDTYRRMSKKLKYSHKI